MVVVYLNECLDELEWWKIWSGGIAKVVAGGSINNSDVWVKFMEGYLVEEAKAKMKDSDWI